MWLSSAVSPNVFYPFYFIFGLLIGSFLNVVILRLPAGQKLTGRSQCPHCGHILAPWELVPLFSFLALRGKCAGCGSKISPRYFIIELACAGLFLLAGYLINPSGGLDVIYLLRDWLIIAVLITVFVIDLEHFLIFDEVIFTGLIIIIALNLFTDFLAGLGFFSLHGYLLGGLLSAGVFSAAFYLVWFVSGGRALGFGDVKLAIFLGAALGWPKTGVGLFIAIMVGGLASIVLLASGSKKLKSRVPFGTFLAIGWIIALFWGEKLLRWYLALLGF